MAEHYEQPAFDFEAAVEQTAEFERHVISSPRPDGSMKRRVIWAPSDTTKNTHKILLHHLYEQEIDMPHAYGAMPGVSIADNVAAHREGSSFYMLDIRDAFPSVDLRRLAITLAPILGRIPGEVYDFLLDYSTVGENSGLILGPPSSPYLFNIYCRELDEELGKISNEAGATYTRWIDDLTFSAPKDAGPIGKRRRGRIREAISDYGFDIADRKSKVHSLEKGPVTITGISLYPNGLFKLSPKLVQKVVEVFDEVEAKIGDTHNPPTEHDLGLVDGYNSVLVSTRDPERSSMTRLERDLDERYRALRATLGNLGLGNHRRSSLLTAIFG